MGGDGQQCVERVSGRSRFNTQGEGEDVSSRTRDLGADIALQGISGEGDIATSVVARLSIGGVFGS